jgi:hypothetical protein
MLAAMTLPRSALAALTFPLTLAWATPAPARACTCAERTLEQHIADADAIFEARVVSVEPLNPAGAGGGPLRVTLDVVQTWRDANAESLEAITPGHAAACGYPFEVGRTYLVYARRVDGALHVGLCSRTRPIEEAGEDRARLGSGVVPVDVDDEDAPDEERRRPQQLPPRGGCAGCSAGGRANPPIGAAVLMLMGAAGALSSPHRRRRRARL